MSRIPGVWCVLEAGDPHWLSPTAALPSLLPTGVTEHLWPSLEGKRASIPSLPPAIAASRVPGQRREAAGSPGLINVERVRAPLPPRIDLINEEPPMVFSTLLSVKITF